jgi:hypothetical protein
LHGGPSVASASNQEATTQLENILFIFLQRFENILIMLYILYPKGKCMKFTFLDCGEWQYLNFHNWVDHFKLNSNMKWGSFLAGDLITSHECSTISITKMKVI